MNPVVHFEMPYEDKNRMAKFYEKAFGWKTTALGADVNEYVLVQTGETDEKGMLKKTNRINGGFYKKKDPKEWPLQYPSVVLATSDIKESMKKITASGGRVLGEPVEIKGYGMYVSFLDTEGNRNSLMEPFMKE